MKKLCIIQANYTDLVNYDLRYNSISPVTKSGLFDEVVIAAPNIKENESLKEFSQINGVDLFLGDVENVSNRLLECSNRYQSKHMARLLLNWFFIDTKLIERMMKLLSETEADYVNLPCNFDIRFGADVFTDDFLKKVLALYGQESFFDDKMLFNPWGFSETVQNRFKIVTCCDVPRFSGEYFHEIMAKMQVVWPERHDSGHAPQYSYKKLADHAGADSHSLKVLDIACGNGNGAHYLAGHFNEVVGVDKNEETIKQAGKRFSKNNLTFQVGDAENLDYPAECFDCVISVHTMEHLDNDEKFLKTCSDVLKNNGVLMIEVPRHRSLPFEKVGSPLSIHHVREYEVAQLKGLLGKHFSVQRFFGISRGYEVPLNKAREALGALCVKDGNI